MTSLVGGAVDGLMMSNDVQSVAHKVIPKFLRKLASTTPKLLKRTRKAYPAILIVFVVISNPNRQLHTYSVCPQRKRKRHTFD